MEHCGIPEYTGSAPGPLTHPKSSMRVVTQSVSLRTVGLHAASHQTNDPQTNSLRYKRLAVIPNDG
jgi:hypothetical protein